MRHGGCFLSLSFKTSCTPVAVAAGGCDTEIQDWIVPAAYADAYGLDLYWQASTRGSEPDDPDGVAAYQELVAAATP